MPRITRLWRGLAWLLLALLLSAAAFLAWAWNRSEAHLTGFPAPPVFTAAIPADAASLANGAHLAVTRGCTSCHGQNLQGEVFHHDPLFGRAVAANLTRYVHDHPPALFERALRHGIGQDGRALYSMPSYNFTRMTDADVAALYAHIRSLPVADTALPGEWLGLPRVMIALGRDFAIPQVIPMVPPLRRQIPPGTAQARGEYLAMTSCNECHGLSLRGDDPFLPPGETPPPGSPPSLAIVAAYDEAAFTRLMRTGKPPGDRDLGLMSSVAKARFSHWTPQEVDDLHAYLVTLADPPAP